MADDVVEVPYDTAAMVTLATEFVIHPMKTPRDNRKIRISMVGKCPRQIAYNIIGTKSQPMSAHMEFTFWQGHSLGDNMTFVLRDMGWVNVEPYINKEGYLDWKGDSEEQVEDERFKGHYDIFTVPLIHEMVEYQNRMYPHVRPARKGEKGKRYLLDFKTMSDRVGFVLQDKDDKGRAIKITAKTTGNPYYKTGGFIFPGNFSKLKGIPKDYWSQLHIYARIKGADGLMLLVMGKDVEKKLAYKNPDYLLNFPIKVFTTDNLDEDHLKDLDCKADYIYSYTKKGEVPPIPAEYEEKGDKFPCAYCNFRHKCFPGLYSLQPGIEAYRPFVIENLEVKSLS